MIEDILQDDQPPVKGKPKFNPNKPFVEVKEPKPKFDPNKPFEQVDEVKKKELTPSTSLGGQLPVQNEVIPETEDKTAVRQDWELKDPITLAKESKELKNKKKLVTSTGGSSFAMGTGGDSYAPDEESIKQSEKIDKHLKILGYDSRDLNDRLEGIPDYIYNQQGTTQKELLDLYKDNKLKFNRLTSTIKGQAKFLDGIDELYSKGNIDEKVLRIDVFQDEMLVSLKSVVFIVHLFEPHLFMGYLIRRERPQNLVY